MVLLSAINMVKYFLRSPFLLLLISLSPLHSQVDLTKYFDQGAIPLLNRSTPVKVDFKWDMDGKSQVLLNEGINSLDEGNFQLALGSLESLGHLSECTVAVMC